MPEWTDKQKIAINNRGRTLLVSAAAGSGKTAVLIERIKKLLIGDGVPLENMLIVTFTKAAAAEMKERLRAELGKALADCEDEKLALFLRRQLSMVGRAEICTFDSFAQKLVRSYYHVIGVDPSLKICDNYKSALLKDEIMEDMFSSLYESKDKDFLELLDHYATAKSDGGVRSMILSLFEFSQTLPDPDAFLSSTGFDPELMMKLAGEQALALCEYALDSCGILTELFENNGVLSCAEKLRDVWSDFDSIKASLEAGRSEEGIRMLFEYDYPMLRAKKDEQDAKKALDDIVKELWDSQKGFKKAISEFKKIGVLNEEILEKELALTARPLSLLCGLTKEFSARYAKRKEREGLMDFSDGEHFALKILENEEVRKECREKYRCIFTDEYQDSNPVQDALIAGISSGDNVFMVGDVKQSIYKFRHAEPELFMEKYKSFKAGEVKDAGVIDLSSNFRSKGSIIDFVNRLFSVLMTESSCGMEYDEDAALSEGLKYEGPYEYEPVLYVADSALYEDSGIGEEIENLKKDELEALMAVDIIREYHGKMICDKSGNDRPLDYSDMTVLLRSTKNRAETYYETLTNAGIPVYLERNEGFFDTPEIQVFVNLLRIIDNFKQDVPLLSVLHFPSFGFSAGELAEIRLYSKKEDLADRYFATALRYYAANADDGLSAKCRGFLEKLDGWRIKAMALPLADFLWELMSESGIMLFAAALGGGEQRLANLRALTDKAAEYESSNPGGLGGFISYIDSISAADSKVSTGQSKIVGEGENVVRIMTVHKSKGLEFPFVLLAGCGSRFGGSGKEGKAVYNKKIGMSMVVSDPDSFTSSNPPGCELIKAQNKKEAMAEEIRVLYVALTRARDILVVSGCVKDAEKYLRKKRCVPAFTEGASCFLDMLVPAFEPGSVRIRTREDFSFDAAETFEGRKEMLRKALAEGFETDESRLPIPLSEIKRRLSYDYFPEEKLSGKRKYSVSEIAAESSGRASDGRSAADAELAVPAFMSGKRRLSAAEAGTAYHTLMEHLDFKNCGKSTEEIAAFIEELTGRGILRPEEAACIKPAEISAFFESGLGRRLCSADEIHKETPFVMKHEYGGREVLVQGTVDCWFREGGKICLLDYKSSYVDMKKPDSELERLKGEYSAQLALYAEALEKTEGRRPEESYLYLFAAGTYIKMGD